MYVLDSSILIEIIERNKQLLEVEKLLGDQPIVTTSICMHELLAGALNQKERIILEKLFTNMQVLDYNSDAARISSKIAQELTREGKKINIFDTLIAGICQSNNAELITMDQDFGKIKDFKYKIIR